MKWPTTKKTVYNNPIFEKKNKFKTSLTIINRFISFLEDKGDFFRRLATGTPR